MPSVHEMIVRRLGRALHVHIDEITHEPLPRRWVDLIHYLDELERRQSKHDDRR